MFSTRFVGGFNSCFKFVTGTPRISLIFRSAMDPVKRHLGDSNNEGPDSSSKKLKTEHEGSVKHIISENLRTSNRTRKPKKVIFLLCYLGKDYFGMQRNNNVLTVEEELFKALLKANIILQEEFDYPKMMKFQRAARTDKGVSAVRNIVSLKIPLEEITESLPEKINLQLPPEVRVIAAKRVTQSFDAKIACDARTYAYMLPTFAFAPTIEGSTEEYRITDDRIQEINSFLKNYLGTRNFYNFTSGRLPGDPSCKRYIMSCECTPPFQSHGLEFSVVKIKGQSFMLHQIRKMVGLAIAVMRNLTDTSILEKTWENERIDIPKAPGLGLMLEELHYDWYNTKFGSDGIHEPIQWKEYDDIIEVFKKENICENIAKSEREEKSMMQWLQTLPHHSYDVRDAGPPSKLPPKLSKTDVIANDTTNVKVENGNVGEAVDSVKSEAVDSIKSETVDSAKHETVDLIKSDTVEVKTSDVKSELCEQITESEIKCPS